MAANAATESLVEEIGLILTPEVQTGRIVAKAVDNVKGVARARICRLSDVISQRKFKKETKTRRKSPLRASGELKARVERKATRADKETEEMESETRRTAIRVASAARTRKKASQKTHRKERTLSTKNLKATLLKEVIAPWPRQDLMMIWLATLKNKKLPSRPLLMEQKLLNQPTMKRKKNETFTSDIREINQHA